LPAMALAVTAACGKAFAVIAACGRELARERPVQPKDLPRVSHRIASKLPPTDRLQSTHFASACFSASTSFGVTMSPLLLPHALRS
jgi:hypothetical protein